MTTATALVARISEARGYIDLNAADGALSSDEAATLRLTLASAEAALDRGSVDYAVSLADVVDDHLNAAADHAAWREEAEEREALRRQGLDVL